MAARIIEQLIEIPAEHERNIFGQFDEHIKKIERTLQVTLISRDGILKIVGPAPNVQKAEKIIRELLGLSVRGNTIQSQNVDYALSLTMEEKEAPLVEMDKDCICHTINGRPVKPKTLGQKAYVDKIREDMIVFGVGPAGTGKTYLAMAMAITAFRNDEVGRIILTRPAIDHYRRFISERSSVRSEIRSGDGSSGAEESRRDLHLSADQQRRCPSPAGTKDCTGL